MTDLTATTWKQQFFKDLVTRPKAGPERFTPLSFELVLACLVETHCDFTPTDLNDALDHIFDNDAIPPTQINAFVTALRYSRLDRVQGMLAAAAQNIRGRVMRAELVDREKHFIVDIVGTGRDRHDTLSVTTTAAVVAAGAGCRVCKVSTIQCQSQERHIYFSSSICHKFA